MQSRPSGKFGRVDRPVVLPHQLKDPLALPVARPAVRPPGPVLVLVIHPKRPLIHLPSSNLNDIIHL
jgi:hypothetical protein